jgi:hypothetical protein
MEEIVLKIKAEGGGDAEQKVKSIKQQLKEAKEAALQAKEGTEEYFAALSKAAGLADQIGDVNKAVNALNPGDKAAAFGNLINTVAGGFQTITGLYGLLGSKSEDVEKLLLKVQAASAVAMGVQSLVEAQKQWAVLSKVIQSTTIFQKANTMATAAAAVVQKLFTGAVNTTSTSFKGLKAAIVSTGIGALVIAIGLAVNALMDFMESTDDATSAQEDLNKQLATTHTVLEAINLAYDAAAIGIKARLDLAKAQGKSLEEINKIEQELFDNNADRLKTKQRADEQDAKATDEAVKKLREKSKLSKDEKTQLDELIAKQVVLGAQMKKNDAEVKAIDTNRQVILLNQDKAIKDRNAKVVQDAKDLKAKLDKIEQEKIDKRKKEEQDDTKFIGDETQKRQEFQRKAESDAIERRRLRRDEEEDIENQKTIKLKEEIQKRRDAQEAADAEIKASQDKELQNRKENIEAGFQLAQAAANSLNTLNDIITNNEKQGLKQGEVLSLETQKRAFKRAQALALVQTTINGAQAISSILGQYPKFDGGFAMVAALVSSTAAIASQYAVIASQKFNPEGGGSGAPPNAPAPINLNGSGSAPNIQAPTNTSGFLQQDSESFKVFVVESDITNAQGIVQQNKKKAILTI